MSIRQLLKVPEERRDVNWLKQSLQSAIELELATIPPYLCAMWSIVDTGHEVRKDVRSIVLDEMLHMGLACNMLTTLGGIPALNTPATVPKYPGGLPGGVRPQLVVWLAGFSRAMVRAVYMEIEYPENGPITLFLDQSYPTIGAFYTAILNAFKTLDPSEIKKERQLSAPGVGLGPICSIADAEAAIKLIKEQGEGTSQDPFPCGDPSDRAHYYRFAELYYGRRLIQVDGHWQYAGAKVCMPQVYPMAEVPPGGYRESRAFDMRYTEILNDMQAAWEKPEQQSRLDDAVRKMFLLEAPARELMMKGLPSGFGNFGPSFQLISKK